MTTHKKENRAVLAVGLQTSLRNLETLIRDIRASRVPTLPAGPRDAEDAISGPVARDAVAFVSRESVSLEWMMRHIQFMRKVHQFCRVMDHEAHEGRAGLEKELVAFSREMDALYGECVERADHALAQCAYCLYTWVDVLIEELAGAGNEWARTEAGARTCQHSTIVLQTIEPELRAFDVSPRVNDTITALRQALLDLDARLHQIHRRWD